MGNETNNPPKSSVDYPQIAAMVEQLAGAIAQLKASPPVVDASVTLRTDYLATLDMIKLLSDIRFRCLVFVTTIVGLAVAFVAGTGDPAAKIMLGLVGLLTTLGITVYELRNSQLYEAACHRAKMLEGRLGMEVLTRHWKRGGLVGERPKYVQKGAQLTPRERTALVDGKDVRLMSFWLVPVKHDQGLALIYGAALGGWFYLVVSGVMALPAPIGMWKPLPPGWSPIIAAALGLAAFEITRRRFVFHDKMRFRPEAPENGNQAPDGIPEASQADPTR